MEHNPLHSVLVALQIPKLQSSERLALIAVLAHLGGWGRTGRLRSEDVARAAGISYTSANRALIELARRGLITREPVAKAAAHVGTAPLSPELVLGASQVGGA